MTLDGRVNASLSFKFAVSFPTPLTTEYPDYCHVKIGKFNVKCRNAFNDVIFVLFGWCSSNRLRMKIKEDVARGGGGGGERRSFRRVEPMEEKLELRRREAEGERK